MTKIPSQLETIFLVMCSSLIPIDFCNWSNPSCRASQGNHMGLAPIPTRWSGTERDSKISTFGGVWSLIPFYASWSQVYALLANLQCNQIVPLYGECARDSGWTSVSWLVKRRITAHVSDVLNLSCFTNYRLSLKQNFFFFFLGRPCQSHTL